MSGQVVRLRRVSRNVGDLKRMTAFYCDALGFEPIGSVAIQCPAWDELIGLPGVRAQAVRLRLGAQEMELVAFDPPGRPYPAQASAADLCFQHLAIVVADIDAAYARLRNAEIQPISEGGPQTLPPNTGSVSAFKFRDPEGHPLELIHFPAGVGAPCWQQASGLFLGIDHSAIAVADTAASVAFYERLGFHVAGRSRNQGPAQSRLDGLVDADVDVVGLGTRAGPPHLELLGYRTPRGRPLQPPAATNDLVADRLVLRVDDLQAVWSQLGEPAHAVVASIGDVDTMLLNDPSGHRLLLEQGREG